MRMKFKPFPSTFVWVIINSFTVLFLSCIYLFFQFAKHTVPEQGFGILILPILLLGMGIYIAIGLWKLGYKKLFMHLCFDSEGILAAFFKKSCFRIAWSEIRTFGVYHYQVSYQKMCVLFFWTTNELFPTPTTDAIAAVTRVDEHHVAIQICEGLLDELKQTAPRKMYEEISAAISHNKNLFSRL